MGSLTDILEAPSLTKKKNAKNLDGFHSTRNKHVCNAVISPSKNRKVAAPTRTSKLNRNQQSRKAIPPPDPPSPLNLNPLLVFVDSDLTFLITPYSGRDDPRGGWRGVPRLCVHLHAPLPTQNRNYQVDRYQPEPDRTWKSYSRSASPECSTHGTDMKIKWLLQAGGGGRDLSDLLIKLGNSTHKSTI